MKTTRPFLNMDLGELGDEPEALYDLLDVAHVACGGHAGDEATMRRALARASERGVAIGAHPSYPDRAGFGRIALSLAPEALAASVAAQVAALRDLADQAGLVVGYAKPHGALYHRADVDRALAFAVVWAIAEELGPRVTIVGPAGGELARAAAGRGLPYAREAFADRAVRRGTDGREVLVPRDEPGALLTEPAAAAARARELAARGDVETICVHGDTPGALAIARAVRAALDAGHRP